MLVDGKWIENWQPVQSEDEQGRFIRQTSSFRHWVTPDGAPGPTGEGGFKAERDRYHLYVAYICPWASRALMARALKGLQDIITVSVVNPVLTDQGWQFSEYPGCEADTQIDAKFMHQIYTHADPKFTGRATVPVLWDKKNKTIVNNESADIVRMFNTSFEELTGQRIDLYPESVQSEIDQINPDMYKNLNNGVYQAGFATKQQAYEEAYSNVFSTLDKYEQRLSDGRAFLFGDNFTESDIRLFVTLIRFDVAYYALFKCNRQRIDDMPNLSAFRRRVYDIEGIKDTVNIEHIKAGYYSIKALNPTGIVPVGPANDFS